MHNPVSIVLASFVELLDSLQWEALLKEYEAESSIAEIGPINPHRDTYAKLEQAGVMQCFIALRCGCVVGFSNLLVSLIPHYGQLAGTVESIFVPSACRRLGIGTALRQSMKAFAKEKGCVGVFHSAPTMGKLERVLERDRRCRRTNAVFFEAID